MSAVIERLNLGAHFTTDGSPNLRGKNTGLLKRIQDKSKGENPELDVLLLHQEVLSALQLDRVVML